MCLMSGTHCDSGGTPSADEKILGEIVSDISYNNAKKYFGF